MLSGGWVGLSPSKAGSSISVSTVTTQAMSFRLQAVCQNTWNVPIITDYPHQRQHCEASRADRSPHAVITETTDQPGVLHAAWTLETPWLLLFSLNQSLGL